MLPEIFNYLFLNQLERDGQVRRCQPGQYAESSRLIALNDLKVLKMEGRTSWSET